jgi:hypothetical protein
MKSFITLFCILFLSPWYLHNAMAQQVVFEKKYTGIDILPPCFVHENAYAIQVNELSDGKILLLGRGYDIDTTYENASERYFDLKKLDKDGNIIWTRYIRPDTILSNNVWIDLTSFQVLDNGQILLIGLKEGGAFGPEVSHVILLNADGLPLFDTVYVNSYPQYIYTRPQCSARTADGFAIAGYTFVPYGDNEAYVLKIDSNYHKQWEFKLSPSNGLWGEFRKVIATSDGNIDCFGKIRKPASDQELFLFVRLNASGQMILFKTYEDSLSWIELKDVLAGPGFRMMVGNYNEQTFYRILLMKTDESGNLLWQKKLSDTLHVGYIPNAITLDNENQFLITGYTMYIDSIGSAWDASDIYLLKTDSSGNKLWEETYGTNLTLDSTMYSTWEFGQDIVQTNDESYLICGGNNINAYYGAVMDLLKIKEGFAGDQEYFFPSGSAVPYPNPFHEYTMLKLPATTDVIEGVLTLYNLSGMIVKRISGIHGNTVFFSRDGVPDGIYFYSLRDHMRVIASGKVIVN